MPREYTVIELKTLIGQAKAGDQEAFAIIYDQFYTPIFRYFYGRTGDKNLAEDLTQDVFLKGYQSLNAYTVGSASPLAYFYTIARHRLVDYWRKNKTETLTDEQLVVIPDDKEKTEKLAVDLENEKILQEGLSSLTTDQREVLTLKYLNGLSTKEVAEMLDKSEEAVRQTIVRALRSMSEKLDKYEF